MSLSIQNIKKQMFTKNKHFGDKALTVVDPNFSLKMTR